VVAEIAGQGLTPNLNSGGEVAFISPTSTVIFALGSPWTASIHSLPSIIRDTFKQLSNFGAYSAAWIARMEFFSDVGDSLKPSLFELIAQEQLRDLLQPALKYVLAVSLNNKLVSACH
jgi:hypothetical protein